MKIEILHIDECPNWEDAGVRTKQALDALGLVDQSVEFVLIRTDDDAIRAGFAGSPTIIVDGTDLFPSGAPTADLACRIYPTERGFAGSPTRAQIEAAIAQRAGLS